MLSRRQFLGAAGGAAGAAAVGGGAWAALVRDSVKQSAEPTSTTSTSATTTSTTTSTPTPTTTLPNATRVLLVVQMAGGNDGLNTLVPSDGAYRDARPVIAIPHDQLVGLTGTDYALHPSLAPLTRWWDMGSMAAVEGVGIPGQSRSHFRSMDTWWSGVPGAASQTGWLGRWLDVTQQGEPDPLRAISLIGGSPMLVGVKSLATVIESAEAFQLRAPEGVDTDGLISAFLATASPLSNDPTLAAAQRAIPSTINAVELLTGVMDEAGSSTEQRSTAVGAFEVAARIVDLGIGTQVITIGLNGFDTHGDQLNRQSALLEDLAAGISVFMNRIEADGHADDVTVMTISEFGRRVAENGSGGTDHGQGGVQFLLGPTVDGGKVHGELDLSNLSNGDVPTRVDERSVYAEVLDWLGGPTDEILGGNHERIGALAA